MIEKRKFENPRFFPDGFFMQRHTPQVMADSHTHGHVEILLPIDCDLTYLTQAGSFTAANRHISVLWGQIPHRVSKVNGHQSNTQSDEQGAGQGGGQIVIANLPLAELLTWSLSETFLSQLFTGRLVTSRTADPLDEVRFDRWLADCTSDNGELLVVARMELQLRLRRQSISGWCDQSVWSDQSVWTDQQDQQGQQSSSQNTAERASDYAQNMIRFMAKKYTQNISISDIADAAKISKGYAMRVFQTCLGMSINKYLTQLRLHHAKAGLMDGNDKVINIALDSGFGSLSRFYEVFTTETGMTPHKFRIQTSKSRHNEGMSH